MINISSENLIKNLNYYRIKIYRHLIKSRDEDYFFFLTTDPLQSEIDDSMRTNYNDFITYHRLSNKEPTNLSYAVLL
jgi:hypothetical protein